MLPASATIKHGTRDGLPLASVEVDDLPVVSTMPPIEHCRDNAAELVQRRLHRSRRQVLRQRNAILARIRVGVAVTLASLLLLTMLAVWVVELFDATIAMPDVGMIGIAAGLGGIYLFSLALVAFTLHQRRRHGTTLPIASMRPMGD